MIRRYLTLVFPPLLKSVFSKVRRMRTATAEIIRFLYQHHWHGSWPSILGVCECIEEFWLGPWPVLRTVLPPLWKCSWHPFVSTAMEAREQCKAATEVSLESQLVVGLGWECRLHAHTWPWILIWWCTGLAAPPLCQQGNTKREQRGRRDARRENTKKTLCTLEE